ncbi:putative molybdenum carrier protein [Microbacterium sp. B2969]|uniref:Molybdenum carrier protein n=1 Tax=Microbacterium alkaliflavum TaxID=3248839 RepID=A0ABW7Q330_9MICO
MRQIAVIRSGGQTGADRGALEAAVAAGVPIAGWCPRGGLAEDFPDPPGLLAVYPTLVETPSDDPAQRTRWNVRDADATLIVVPGSAWHSPGTDLTRRVALELERPVFTLTGDDLSGLRAWLETVGGAVLNVAGPRESQAPGIQERTRRVVASLLGGQPA